MWFSFGFALLLLMVTGCAVNKTVTITTKPADASVKVNGLERGRGTVVERFTFERPGDVFYVTASRKGFQDRTVSVTRESADSSLFIELRPHVRRISITTSPVPAIISIDGKPLTAEPVSAISADVEFTVNEKDEWITHTITAERKGFIKAEQIVQWTDPQPLYNMKLDAMRKDLRITTSPPGAKVFIDGEEIGKSPVVDRQRPFEFDTGTNTWVERVIRVEKPGYDPIEKRISWDNGNVDYPIELIPKRKAVTIITDPPGAKVEIDGVPVLQKDEGPAYADLVYPPINEAGDLRTYTARITKKTAEAEYYPATLEIPWEDGKTEYKIKLREILSQPIPATMLKMVREKGEWAMRAEPVQTIGMKFVTEPEGPSPQKIVQVGPGETIGSLSISPDGQFLVYTVIGGEGSEPTSQMYRIRTDGTGGATSLSDGRSLDVTPSFTAAGDRIVFSSNRAGKKLSIWAISATGEGGVTRFTQGDTNDLYPSVDADAKPRLFYQAHIDTRSDPRLYMVQVGTNLQTDLTMLGGTQPRVSPRNDSVVYVQVNEKTGKRDIYRVSDRGGAAESLTYEADNIDPSWNAGGSQIAFASDRGKEAEDGRNNYDIWVLDLNNPNQPRQITKNGSVDDMPVFDPAGDAIYFRSNRGGAWGIWKIGIK